MTIQEQIEERFAKETALRVSLEKVLVALSAELRARDLDNLDLYRKVEVGLSVKGMKSWRAISSLFFGGFEEDAEIVLRSLVEVVIDMEFISLDPDEEARRFTDYEVVHSLRWMREGRSRAITEAEELARLEKILEGRSRDVLTRRPEWREYLPVGWSNKKTPQKVDALAERAQDERERVIYLTFMSGSLHTHPNPVAVQEYFFQIEKGKVDFKAEPTIPEESKTFMEACIFVHRLLVHLNKVVGLGKDRECEEARAGVEDIMQVFLDRRQDGKGGGDGTRV